MKFNYVNITGKECKGWLNLFFGEYCVGMVNDIELADMIRREIPEKGQAQPAGQVDIDYQLQRLLNKVNRVTSAHRHRQAISNTDLDALSNRQIEIETAIATQSAVQPDANICAVCGRPMGNPVFCIFCEEEREGNRTA